MPTEIDNDIVKIYRDTAKPSYFMIDWMLHDRCTYNCSYCPPANKSGNDNWLKLDVLDRFCDNLESHVRNIDPNFKIKVLFTGGEPTVWKNFSDLVSRLSQRGWYLIVNTNASRSESWWNDYADKFVQIIFSYHSEFADDDEFIRKLKICEQTTRTMVNIMINPDIRFFDKSIAIGKKIQDSTEYVSTTYYKIQHTFGNQEIKVPFYTKNQIQIIKSLEDYDPQLPKKYNAIYDNYLVKYKDGTIDKLDPVGILNQKKVNFFNWKCSVGLESIFIDAKGDILRATCRAGESIGNILRPNEIKWNTTPIICPYTWCGCITDIKNSKEK